MFPKMYHFLKNFLFTLPPERAHHFVLQSLQLAYRCGLARFYAQEMVRHPKEIMGLHFPNVIGLSAGFDRHGDYIDALASLGFGFIEIGSVLPEPQMGNPPPRIFRLKEDEAFINRVGFASKGLSYVVRKLEKINYRGILGINIGKNKATPNERAHLDYLLCLQALWKFASYITINISSPNTPFLRDLLQVDALDPLLTCLKQEQKKIFRQHKKYIPLVLKISPDLNEAELSTIADLVLQHAMDGLIVSNTTLNRSGDLVSPYAKEMGGLSGRPLFHRNFELIRFLYPLLQNKIPMIASGGIMDVASAKAALKAGAQLLQIYTGLIYHGPQLITKLARTLNC